MRIPYCGAHVVVVVVLLQLLDERRSLLVLAALVLEPDADDARAESGHLDELVLHQRVGARVGRVARAQRVQLFLVQHRPDARRLRVRRRRRRLPAARRRRHVTRRTTSASARRLLLAGQRRRFTCASNSRNKAVVDRRLRPPGVATREVTLSARKVVPRASVGLQQVLLRTVYSQAQGFVCAALQLGGDVEQP